MSSGRSTPRVVVRKAVPLKSVLTQGALLSAGTTYSLFCYYLFLLVPNSYALNVRFLCRRASSLRERVQTARGAEWRELSNRGQSDCCSGTIRGFYQAYRFTIL